MKTIIEFLKSEITPQPVWYFLGLLWCVFLLGFSLGAVVLQ